VGLQFRIYGFYAFSLRPSPLHELHLSLMADQTMNKIKFGSWLQNFV